MNIKNTISSELPKVSRRKFLVGTAAAGGGLALGFSLPFGIGEAAAQSGAAATEVNIWVVVRFSPMNSPARTLDDSRLSQRYS